MDNLLAGTLFSLIRGVSMPVIVQRRCRLLLFVCGEHSAPSRTPFRPGDKTVRLANGMAFTFTTEYCSDSQRNGVRLQTGIAFIFDRIPQSECDSAHTCGEAT
jgi:hypothetical protein